MKKSAKILSGILTLTMLCSLAACGSDNGKKNEQTTTTESQSATEVSSSDVLKGVFDTFKSNESYTIMKSAYSNTTFEETLDGENIVVKISGTDGLEGTYTFPAKDGYISCEVPANDYMSVGIFTFIANSVGEYYKINTTLFSGYIQGVGISGIQNKTYSVDLKEDGSGTMKIYYAEKPEMKELDEMFINEKPLNNFGDDVSNFNIIFGKLAVNGVVDRENKTLSLAIGEYGDKNTELTRKSIIEIVNFFKPDGYEDFVKDFTELKTVSNDKYKVHTDTAEYDKERGIELIDGYTFMFVTFGNNGGSVTEE